MMHTLKACKVDSPHNFETLNVLSKVTSNAQSTNSTINTSIKHFFDTRELPQEQLDLANSYLAQTLLNSDLPISFLENWFF